jgi:hypothetical protein
MNKFSVLRPGGMFSPPAEPPSPDRLELKENRFVALEPPSPGRLALKGIETDEEDKLLEDVDEENNLRKPDNLLKSDSDRALDSESESDELRLDPDSRSARLESKNDNMESPERNTHTPDSLIATAPNSPTPQKDAEIEDELISNSDEKGEPDKDPSVDISPKDLKRIKILSHKRSNIESPTLREIAITNASAKRFRTEGE